MIILINLMEINKNFIIISICIKISICIIFFSVGVWESNIASTNQPNNVKLSDTEKEAYAFTIVKSIINILTGIFSMCLNNSNKSDDSDNKSKSSCNQFICINFGISIWGIVMYSNMIKNDSLFGPFNQVILAEFIIFITSGIFIILLLACTIIVLVIDSATKDNDNTKKNEPTNIIKNIENPTIVNESITIKIIDIPIS